MTTTKSLYVPWDGEGQPPPKERSQFYVKTREGYDPDKNGLHLSRWAPHNRHMLSQVEREKISVDNKTEKLLSQRRNAYNPDKSSSTSPEATARRSNDNLVGSKSESKASFSPYSIEAPDPRPNASKVLDLVISRGQSIASNADVSYIPPHMRGQAPARKVAFSGQLNTSTRSLSPEANEFVSVMKEKVISTRSLSPEAAEFKPRPKQITVPTSSIYHDNLSTVPSQNELLREYEASLHSTSPNVLESAPHINRNITPTRSLSLGAADSTLQQANRQKEVTPHLQVVVDTLEGNAPGSRILDPESSEEKADLHIFPKPDFEQKIASHILTTISKVVTLEADSEKAKTPYIPPHLRNFSSVQKSKTHHHAIAETSKTSSPQAIAKDLVDSTIGVQAVSVNTDVSQLSVIRQELPEKVYLPLLPNNGGLTSISDYSAWLEQKNQRDLAVKKNSVANRAALEAEGPVVTHGNNWRQPPTGKVIAVGRHSHFQVDVNQGPASFQTFLKEKDTTPDDNGKRYKKLSKLSPEARSFDPPIRSPSPMQLNAKASAFTPTPPPSPPNANDGFDPAAPSVEYPIPGPKAVDRNNTAETCHPGLRGRSLSPEAAEFHPHKTSNAESDDLCGAKTSGSAPHYHQYYPKSPKVPLASKDLCENTDTAIFESIPEEVIAAIKARPGLAASRWAKTSTSQHLPKSSIKKVDQAEVGPMVAKPSVVKPNLIVLETAKVMPVALEVDFLQVTEQQINKPVALAPLNVDSKLPILPKPLQLTSIPTTADPYPSDTTSKHFKASATNLNTMNHLRAQQINSQVAKFKELLATRNSTKASTSSKTHSQTSIQSTNKTQNQIADNKILAINNVAMNGMPEQPKRAVSSGVVSSGGWGTKPAAFNLNTVIAEVALVPTFSCEKLTGDLIHKGWGHSGSNDCSNSFDAKISDEGVATNGKEIVRNTQGKDPAEELLDWDNSWRPAACDWEERKTFDTSYMNEYIVSDWQPNLPQGKVNFDLRDPYFISGKCPVKNFDLESEYAHDITIADIEASIDQDASLFQTSENAAFQYNERELKDKAKRDAMTVVPVPSGHIQHMDLGTHEFAPDVDIYLRPAQPSDAAQTAAIYNHYVNTHHTEDVEPVTEAIIKQLGKISKEEKLPFLVAVSGRAPAKYTTHAGQNIPIPPNETILGFSVARTWAYGINGLRSGRSRLTANLEVFVRHDHLRKGIGRSLLDRLLQCCSPGYAGRDGYSWINPNPDNDVYGKPGGVYYLYSLVIQVIAPAGKAKEVDDDFLWKRKFLRKYWFDEEVVLKGFSRSSRASPDSKFFDNVIFTKLAALDGEVPPFA